MASSVGSGFASSSLARFLDPCSFRRRNGGARKKKQQQVTVCRVSSAIADPYKTLRIRPDASESEVKTAFRKLALQYHPDVCRGNNCTVQFHQINEAYAAVMNHLREEETSAEESDGDEASVNDSEWDLWEEWMGWEGAGIRDYSSHINPYI